MKIIIQIISYYKGFFEFRICLYNDICRFVVQECFDEYFMIIKEGFLESFYICFYLLNLKVMGKDKYYLILFILRGMCCEQCVLQWMYNIGKYICQWYGNRCILLLYFFFCNYFGMSILIKLYGFFVIFQEIVGVLIRMVLVVWDVDYRRYLKIVWILVLEGCFQLKLYKLCLLNLKLKKIKLNCNMKLNQGYFMKFEKLLKILKQ